jgi:hypothetical protein
MTQNERDVPRFPTHTTRTQLLSPSYMRWDLSAQRFLTNHAVHPRFTSTSAHPKRYGAAPPESAIACRSSFLCHFASADAQSAPRVSCGVWNARRCGDLEGSEGVHVRSSSWRWTGQRRRRRREPKQRRRRRCEETPRRGWVRNGITQCDLGQRLKARKVRGVVNMSWT